MMLVILHIHMKSLDGDIENIKKLVEDNHDIST